MANDNFELGKSFEDFAVRIKLHGDKFFQIVVHLIIRGDDFQTLVVADRRVNHQGHVQLDRLLIQRIPIFVVHPGRLFVAGRIGIQISADEAQFFDAALELGQAVARVLVPGLR